MERGWQISHLRNESSREFVYHLESIIAAQRRHRLYRVYTIQGLRGGSDANPDIYWGLRRLAEQLSWAYDYALAHHRSGSKLWPLASVRGHFLFARRRNF